MKKTAPGLGPLLLILAAPALALAAPPPPATSPAAAAAAGDPNAPNPDASYYPAAARAAGVEGQAVIHCARTSHLKLKDCTLVSETPAGQGFGQAALAMAAANQPNPLVDTADPDLVAPADIPLRFGLHPPGVDPDISEVAHVVTAASVVTAPTRDQVRSAYPVRALSDQVEGLAVLDCIVSADGLLTGCHVAGERPDGYGFGQAALDLSADFKLKPREIDGAPQVGAAVRIPVPFSLSDPSAPLQIQGPTPPP